MPLRRTLAALIAVLALLAVGLPVVHWWRTAPIASATGYRVRDAHRLAVVVEIGERDTFEVSAQESSTKVLVTVRVAHDDTDSDGMAHAYSKDVVLDSPLGERTVVDVATGQELPQLP